LAGLSWRQQPILPGVRLAARLPVRPHTADAGGADRARHRW